MEGQIKFQVIHLKQQEGVSGASEEHDIEKRWANSLSLSWAIGNKVQRYLKDVYMLSTIHDDSMVHQPDRGHQNQHQTNPTCVADYNKYMGGVDRTDQLLNPTRYLAKPWSGTRRWPSTFCSFECSTASLLIKKMAVKNHSWDFNVRWLQPFCLEMEMVPTWRSPEWRIS